MPSSRDSTQPGSTTKHHPDEPVSLVGEASVCTQRCDAPVSRRKPLLGTADLFAQSRIWVHVALRSDVAELPRPANDQMPQPHEPTKREYDR
jgi:hypothetical protein